MKYKQLDDRMKAQIDILLDSGLSMIKVGVELGISHSTISRYKNNVYKKRENNIQDKYPELIAYLNKNNYRKSKSIDVCVNQFVRYNLGKRIVTSQQVYNWINNGKLEIEASKMCYKRRKRKKQLSGMMNHLKWNMDNKTVLPIKLRPKSIDERNELGHLEIDSIIRKRNEYSSIISIVDRCSRVIWLIKAQYNQDYYIMNLIYNFIVDNKIETKSITTDNGLEFNRLGIAAKRLGVKLYKCDPYCSFKRGSNEHANGIVRRYISKGNSVYKFEQQYLDDICFKINSMPRKMFDFKTAYEVEFYKMNSGAVEI